MEAVMHFDGACQPNPGNATGAFILKIRDGDRIEKRLSFGQGTCNTAEFMALMEGMKDASARGVKKLEVYGDSRIVINAMRKRQLRPKSKTPHLEQLKKVAFGLADRFESIDWNWVPREENAEADSMTR